MEGAVPGNAPHKKGRPKCPENNIGYPRIDQPISDCIGAKERVDSAFEKPGGRLRNSPISEKTGRAHHCVVGDVVRDHDAMLGQKASDLVHQLCPVRDQALADAMHRLKSQLFARPP